jgi:hypothetical protein
MGLPITNSIDLKDEIARLKGLEQQQADQLKQHFSSPGAIFSTITGLFSGSSENKDEKNTSLFNQDFIGLISRIVLPIALNKTLFKNSGFIVKAIVGLLSQKASSYITGDAVGGIWGKLKSTFEENVTQNPAVSGIVDKVKGIFGGKTKPDSKSRNRIKDAPVPAYVQAS